MGIAGDKVTQLNGIRQAANGEQDTEGAELKAERAAGVSTRTDPSCRSEQHRFTPRKPPKERRNNQTSRPSKKPYSESLDRLITGLGDYRLNLGKGAVAIKVKLESLFSAGSESNVLEIIYISFL